MISDTSTQVVRLRSFSVERLLAAFLMTALVLITCFALVRTASSDWTPVGDEAGIWLRTWDVGTENTPLTGVFSRMGWQHPGPLQFYVSALPLRLLGGKGAGLLLSTLLVSLTCVAGIVVLTARRAGGGAALVLALTTAVLCIGYEHFIFGPWNPYVAILPFALFLVAVWLAAAGDLWATGVAAAAGTFAAQSHLGALPPLLLIGAGAAALRSVCRPGEAAASRRKQALCAAVVLGVLWAPPVVQQIKAGAKGNLTLIYDFFRNPGPELPVGWLKGIRIAGAQLVPWGAWIGEPRVGMLNDLLPGSEWDLAIACAPVVLGFWLAARFRDDLGLRLCSVVAIAFVASIVAHAQIRGLPFVYLTLWTRSVAMLAFGAPLIVLVRNAAQAERVLGRAPQLVVALALSIACLTVSVRSLGAKRPNPVHSELYARLYPRVRAAVERGEEVRIVHVGPLYETYPQALAIPLELGGAAPKLRDDFHLQVGAHRLIADADPRRTLFLAVGAEAERLEQQQRARQIVKFDPLPVARRARVGELRAQLTEQLMATERKDLAPILADPDPWFAVVAPAALDRATLREYLQLSAGIDKRVIAVFDCPETQRWQDVLWPPAQ